MSLLAIVIKGGWIMIPLLLCSLIAVIVIIERIVTLRKARINTDHFMSVMRNTLIRREVERALELCDNTPGPISAILKAGIKKHNRPKAEISEAVTNAGKLEIFQLERYLGIVGSIAGAAPLIGFLGTVTGMIRAFMKIETLGGNVNASVLAGGIWEALITTAAGLCVGIPTLLFYNYLHTKIGHFVYEIEVAATELLDLLTEKRTTSSGQKIIEVDATPDIK